ncbi:2-oxoglutarate dehydrogenase, E2 component, dihydrolipoamide succinyltransferase [Arthrobacter pityocampae]|uniref:Dihydrolipoamide acetyltransferase component of pyruvate dehydrogenase complex n=1 Tax=Arthrobacter pityocampae TaxID=547334 RepID=A0A2S5J040_9MICC|nr:2-oxoglutarate dehydrogenase, E2 component, dihydrolipoamide succinyltransferase [Arthrobacter pityocampae]PPB50212.1 2-oxoglutarate dehydrogenase, E2 component, dihydrolipoamide succinyltransferase [Arthrobacter pityocampae]
MSESVNLPALGESVTEGTVTRWLKQVGDRVEVDEPLLEVSTDKVDTEIPSPIAGVIEEILVAEDETAEVGAPLVRIGDGSGSDDSGSADSGSADAGSADSDSAASAAPAEEEAPAEPEAAPEKAAPEAAPAAESSDSSADESAEGTEVTLPALGESVTEGTVTRWLKAVGDDVEVDEPLLEVSTDKVDTEIPSPVAGKLQEIRVNEDETAEVGAVLAVIGSGAAAPKKVEAASGEPLAAAPSEERDDAPAEKSGSDHKAEQTPEPAEDKPAAPAPAQDKPAAKPAAEDKAAAKPAADSAPAEVSGGSDAAAYVTPLVRRLANQNDVDLSTVKGTGVGGRIRKQDVLEAAEAKKVTTPEPAASAPAAAAPSKPAAPAVEPSKLRGTVEKAPRIRQTIAKRMRESLEVSAQLTQVIEVDMTRIAKLRTASKDTFLAQNGAKLTFLPFLSKAVTEALKQHPKLNASFDEEKKEVTYHDAEHLAIAVDTEKGLLVPVIRDAGNLNLGGLAKKIADVGARTRNGQIGPDELSGGTFTITNIGSAGALFDTPIINQPQVGILGTGIIVKRPVVVTGPDGDDTIAIRSMMYLSLTYDHRLVDGADAGRFLQTLKARLEGGAFEADLGL